MSLMGAQFCDLSLYLIGYNYVTWLPVIHQLVNVIFYSHVHCHNKWNWDNLASEKGANGWHRWLAVLQHPKCYPVVPYDSWPVISTCSVFLSMWFEDSVNIAKKLYITCIYFDIIIGIISFPQPWVFRLKYQEIFLELWKLSQRKQEDNLFTARWVNSW